MKTTHDKFQKDLLKASAILKHYKIAELLEHTHPDFEEGRTQYAQAKFKLYNQEVFEEICDHVAERAKQHGSRITLALWIYEDKRECDLILDPTKGIPRNSWLEETENFIAHIAPGIKDYEMKTRGA